MAPSILTAQQRKAAPSYYAASYVERAVKLWKGSTGEEVRHACSALLDGVRPELVVAFVAPSRAYWNTTEATSGKGREVGFHELGLFQIPAGLRGGPAPNPEPNAASNFWGRNARHPAVVKLLGRPATVRPDAWRTAVADQCALGCLMLARDYASCAASIRADATKRGVDYAPASPATPWGMAVMMTAFSRGERGALELFAHHAAWLAEYSEPRRFAALVNATAIEVAEGRQSRGRADYHSDREHSVLRTWQKFALAGALCTRVGTDPKPFLVADGPALGVTEELVVRGNYNLDAGGLRVAKLPVF